MQPQINVLPSDLLPIIQRLEAANLDLSNCCPRVDPFDHKEFVYDLCYDVQKALEAFYTKYKAQGDNKACREWILALGWEKFVQMVPEEYVAIVGIIYDEAPFDDDEYFERFLHSVNWAGIGLRSILPKDWNGDDWGMVLDELSKRKSWKISL